MLLRESKRSFEHPLVYFLHFTYKFYLGCSLSHYRPPKLRVRTASTCSFSDRGSCLPPRQEGRIHTPSTRRWEACCVAGQYRTIYSFSKALRDIVSAADAVEGFAEQKDVLPL